MINSETISFDLLGYGKFTLDGEGLTYVKNFELFRPSEIAQELSQTFNEIYSESQHLTPIEALGKIPDHFYVTEDSIQNVEINKLEEISEPTDEIIF